MKSSRQDSATDDLATKFRRLHLERQRRKSELRRPRRGRLTSGDRDHILKKTGGRCHICGGLLVDRWQADHVLAHSGRGHDDRDNYLPAHALCNNYRWDYTAEEFQYILKLGVWLRTQIEKGSAIGREASDRFASYERARSRRRKR